MNVLVFSDLHLHEWNYAANHASGINSRLAYQREVLWDILNSAYEYDVMSIVCCGDFFHTHGKITAPILDVAGEFITNITNGEREFYCLVGNHDMADKAGRFNSLRWMIANPYVTVIDKPINHSMFSFCPFTEKKQIVEDFLNNVPNGDVTVFMHQGVQGVPVNNGWELPNEILRSEMIPEHVVNAFTGHYHNHQKISNKLTVVGAPMQHTWADVGQKRGWLIYNTNSGQYKHIESKHPKFILFDKEIDKPDQIEGNFIRVTNPTSNIETIRDRLTHLGAAYIDIVETGVNTDIIIDNAYFDLDTAIGNYEDKLNLDDQTRKIGRELRDGTYEIPVTTS